MNVKRKSRGENEPPPRWLHCPRKGNVMPLPAKFLPLKTPLDSKFNQTVPEECRFSPSMLVDGVDNLGLIIDLTKTDRLGLSIHSFFCTECEIIYNAHNKTLNFNFGWFIFHILDTISFIWLVYLTDISTIRFQILRQVHIRGRGGGTCKDQVCRIWLSAQSGTSEQVRQYL